MILFLRFPAASDCRLRSSDETFTGDRPETSKLYRIRLYREGQEIIPDYATGQRGRRGFFQKDLEAVEQLDGKMQKTEVLRYRVRYFTDGAALGTSAFLENDIQEKPWEFRQASRQGCSANARS